MGVDRMRVVYSFSVPDSSIAHWQLKKWKAAGLNISGHLLKLIEGEGSQILHLENQLATVTDVMGRQGAILEALGTSVDLWRLADRGRNGYDVHGAAVHPEHAAHMVERAKWVQKFHTSMVYAEIENGTQKTFEVE